jgi:hypothetical protein
MNASSTSCASCPAGRYADTAGARDANGCQRCKEGKVQRQSGKTFCLDAQTSNFVRDNKEFACPVSLVDEARCDNGILEYRDGFWHDLLDLTNPRPPIVNADGSKQFVYGFIDGQILIKTSKFYRCRGKCKVGVQDGSITCPRGSRGVLCGLCDDGFFPGSNGDCEKCDVGGSEFVSSGWLLVVLAIVTVGAAVLVTQYLVKLDDRWSELQDKLTSKFKLTAAFYSITLMIGNVYEVRYPQVYLDFLSFFAYGGFWVGRSTAQSHQPPGRAGQPAKSNDKSLLT